MVARPGLRSATEWTALNACLVPVAALDGQELVTAEGLGTASDLHPVQREMAVRGGSQCGYCTPGFVCSMAAEYYRPGRASADRRTGPTGERTHEHGPNGFDLHALSGNLCRCTGLPADPRRRIRTRRPGCRRRLRGPLRGASAASRHHAADPRRRRVRAAC